VPPNLRIPFIAEVDGATAYFRDNLRARTHVDHQDKEAIKRIFMI
jgi:hypothetical protein